VRSLIWSETEERSWRILVSLRTGGVEVLVSSWVDTVDAILLGGGVRVL